jgi:hypothetical protein
MPPVFRLMTEDLRSPDEVAYALCPKIPRTATSFASLTAVESRMYFDRVWKVMVS